MLADLTEPTVSSLSEAPPLHELFAVVRQQSGLSFQQLAERANVSVGYIHGIEKGIKRPSRDYIICLGNAMGLDTEQLNELIVAGRHRPLSPFIRKRDQI